MMIINVTAPQFPSAYPRLTACTNRHCLTSLLRNISRSRSAVWKARFILCDFDRRTLKVSLLRTQEFYSQAISRNIGNRKKLRRTLIDFNSISSRFLAGESPISWDNATSIWLKRTAAPRNTAPMSRKIFNSSRVFEIILNEMHSS